jgi:hypothetical protein
VRDSPRVEVGEEGYTGLQAVQCSIALKLKGVILSLSAAKARNLAMRTVLNRMCPLLGARASRPHAVVSITITAHICVGGS